MAEAAKPKRPVSTHPKFLDMTIDAIQEIADKKGASVGAIKSFILEKYPTVDQARMKSQLKKALEKGQDEGLLIRPKSSEDSKGLTGRFKVDKAKIASIQKAKEKKTVKKTKETEVKPVKKKASAKATKAKTEESSSKKSKSSTPSKMSESSTPSKRSASSTPTKSKGPVKRKAKSPGKKTAKPKTKTMSATTPKPKTKKTLPKQTPSKAKLTKKRT